VSFPDKLEYSAEYEVKIKKDAVIPASKMSTGFEKIKFTTEGITDGDIGVSDGGIYTTDWETKKYIINLTLPENAEYSIYISNDEGESFSDFALTGELEAGKYILVTVAEKSGKQEVKKYSFEVINSVAPYAENIGIEGKMFVGNTVMGIYTFKDDNTTDS